jgi:potassium efflux system protein
MAQQEGALDLEEVRTQRELAESNEALDEAIRSQTLELYDSAISSLVAAAASETQVRSFERERARIRERIESLRERLSLPSPEPEVTIPEGATAAAAERVLAEERSRLAASRAALAEAEQLARQRAEIRNELSRRLGALEQETETVTEELAAVTQGQGPPELKRAARISLQARREALLQQMNSLRAQKDLLDERRELVPWQIDRTQRRITFGEQVVALNEAVVRTLLMQDAARSLEEVRSQSLEAVEQVPELAEVAAEVDLMAENLWGTEGAIQASENTARAITVRSKNVADLNRLIQLTIRKFQAFGRRGSISRWWPVPPDDFPKPGDVAREIQDLEWQIPEAQHDLIRLEQDRLQARELRTRIVNELRVAYPGDDGRGKRNVARELLSVRRELLDRLVQTYGRHANQLVELQSLSRRFLSELEGITSFLYEQLLWVRSVPRPVIPQPGDVFAALLWLISPENWTAALRVVYEGFSQLPGKGSGALVLLVLLISLRPWMRRRMAVLAKRVSSPVTDSFLATLESLAYTLILAAPLPLIFYSISGLLSESASSPFLYSAAGSMAHIAWIVALLEVTRQCAAPRGLAEAHFGWPHVVTRPIYRGLLIAEVVCLPALYFSIQFVMAGIRFSSPEQLQVYNNSLGRILFIGAMSVLGFSLLGLFRPRKSAKSAAESVRSSSLHRIYMYAYPLVMLTTLIPVILAVLGYYVTAILLAHQMVKTLWLILGLTLLSNLLLRWRTWDQREMAHGSADEVEGVAGSMLPGAEAQVRALFRFVVVLCAVIGLYSVWSDAVPTLRILNRIQVWPTITMLEDEETVSVFGTSGQTAEEVASKDVETSASDSETDGDPVTSAVTASSTETAAGDPDTQPLTLWSVLKALLALTITWVLVKNVPGLLELILQKRSLLDLGARIAVGSLVRYAIIIFGVSAAFNLLGISWSKVQWLAAALTFGLGFGLQEIVANFVSGLILLTERPVRVGDAVSIGNLQGRVTRIQIRCTTVTLWDRSEMIVPNKEFVTSKLINWTLSDSRRRMDIPLRVAYGSDLEKVKEALLDVARANPDVLDKPPPQALLLGFGDDAIKFELRIFVDFGKGLAAKDAVQMEVDRVFRERGIDFALPSLNIELPGRKGRKQKALSGDEEEDLPDGTVPAT